MENKELRNPKVRRKVAIHQSVAIRQENLNGSGTIGHDRA